MTDIPTDVVPDTSASLIRRIQLGEAEAWTRFVKIYSPLIYSKCRSKSLSAEDSAEIMQDVFFRVHHYIRAFKPTKERASFRSWLRTVAGNVVVDHFRKQKFRYHQLDTETLTLQLNSVSRAIFDEPDSAQKDRDALDIVSQAIECVRPEFESRTWQAFWRFAIDGLSSKDVGEELGMTQGAVRQAKLAVKKRLQIELDGLV